MTTVSVIIVNYNAGALLAESVERVLKSTIPVDVYVVDNASSDNSIAFLRSECQYLSNLHILENNKNLGFSTANNLALQHTSSDFYLFLNPDCLIDSDTIEKMLDVLYAYSDVGMAGCLVMNSDGSEQRGCRRLVPTPLRSLSNLFKLGKYFPNGDIFRDFNLTGTPLPNHPVYVDAISGAFMLVRRSALELVGPLDPNYFLHCEDLDWCMRFSQAGFGILFVPDVVITHIKGSCSVNRPIFVEWHKHKGMLRFYRKFFLHQYPRYLTWLIEISVWLRFAIVSSYLSMRKISHMF